MTHGSMSLSRSGYDGIRPPFLAGGYSVGHSREVPAGIEALDDAREYGLDSTLAETFPCSDPLSSIPNPHPQPE